MYMLLELRAAVGLGLLILALAPLLSSRRGGALVKVAPGLAGERPTPSSAYMRNTWSDTRPPHGGCEACPRERGFPSLLWRRCPVRPDKFSYPGLQLVAVYPLVPRLRQLHMRLSRLSSGTGASRSCSLRRIC